MTTRDAAIDGPGAHAPIVIGVDGSAHCRSAIAWATAAAERSGRDLLVVSAAHEFLRHVPMFSSHFDPRALDEFAAAAVQRVCEAISSSAPAVTVRSLVRPAHAAELLVEQADHAHVVVLGRRGLGGFARAMLGSTSIAVAGRAACPVVVVPDSWDQRTAAARPVLVGVDIYAHDDAALWYAFERAQELHVPLIAVHGWQTHPAMEVTAEEQRRWSAEVADALQAVITPWQAKFPDVAVELRQLHDHPAFALLESGVDIQLIVLGRHTGSRRLGGLAFGSVTRAVLHYATTPVAVVPQPSFAVDDGKQGEE